MLKSERREVGIPSEKSLGNHPENTPPQNVLTLDAEADKMRNYPILQRNMIPTLKYAAEKDETSDPHDKMAPQNAKKAIFAPKEK